MMSEDKEARVKELKRLLTTPEEQLVPQEFKDLYGLWDKINALVGRSVMTHEFAFPDLLYDEIKSGQPGKNLAKSIEEASKLTKSGKGFIVDLDSESVRVLDTKQKLSKEEIEEVCQEPPQKCPECGGVMSRGYRIYGAWMCYDCFEKSDYHKQLTRGRWRNGD